MTFIMTRRYRKTLLSVQTWGIQLWSVRAQGLVAKARWPLCARAESQPHSCGTSRKSNGHYMQHLAVFTAIVPSRKLFIYIISLIHLHTLYIIFCIVRSWHTTEILPATIWAYSRPYIIFAPTINPQIRQYTLSLQFLRPSGRLLWHVDINQRFCL